MILAAILCLCGAGVMALTDEYWMQQALGLARLAERENEVPVGAVVVKNNVIIGRGFNQPIGLHDPSAHAEIQALRDAARYEKNYRLIGARLYVTLEPCIMCAGAIIHSRIDHLFFGATEPKAGAVVSRTRQLDEQYVNHRVGYTGGLCATECSTVISDFFARRRQEKAQQKREPL